MDPDHYYAFLGPPGKAVFGADVERLRRGPLAKVKAFIAEDTGWHPHERVAGAAASAGLEAARARELYERVKEEERLAEATDRYPFVDIDPGGEGIGYLPPEERAIPVPDTFLGDILRHNLFLAEISACANPGAEFYSMDAKLAAAAKATQADYKHGHFPDGTLRWDPLEPMLPLKRGRMAGGAMDLSRVVGGGGEPEPTPGDADALWPFPAPPAGAEALLSADPMRPAFTGKVTDAVASAVMAQARANYGAPTGLVPLGKKDDDDTSAESGHAVAAVQRAAFSRVLTTIESADATDASVAAAKASSLALLASVASALFSNGWMLGKPQASGLLRAATAVDAEVSKKLRVAVGQQATDWTELRTQGTLAVIGILNIVLATAKQYKTPEARQRQLRILGFERVAIAPGGVAAVAPPLPNVQFQAGNPLGVAGGPQGAVPAGALPAGAPGGALPAGAPGGALPAGAPGGALPAGAPGGALPAGGIPAANALAPAGARAAAAAAAAAGANQGAAVPYAAAPGGGVPAANALAPAGALNAAAGANPAPILTPSGVPLAGIGTTRPTLSPLGDFVAGAAGQTLVAETAAVDADAALHPTIDAAEATVDGTVVYPTEHDALVALCTAAERIADTLFHHHYNEVGTLAAERWTAYADVYRAANNGMLPPAAGAPGPAAPPPGPAAPPPGPAAPPPGPAAPAGFHDAVPRLPGVPAVPVAGVVPHPSGIAAGPSAVEAAHLAAEAARAAAAATPASGALPPLDPTAVVQPAPLPPVPPLLPPEPEPATGEDVLIAGYDIASDQLRAAATLDDQAAAIDALYTWILEQPAGSLGRRDAIMRRRATTWQAINIHSAKRRAAIRFLNLERLPVAADATADELAAAAAEGRLLPPGGAAAAAAAATPGAAAGRDPARDTAALVRRYAEDATLGRVLPAVIARAREEAATLKLTGATADAHVYMAALRAVNDPDRAAANIDTAAHAARTGERTAAAGAARAALIARVRAGTSTAEEEERYVADAREYAARVATNHGDTPAATQTIMATEVAKAKADLAKWKQEGPMPAPAVAAAAAAPAAAATAVGLAPTALQGALDAALVFLGGTDRLQNSGYYLAGARGRFEAAVARVETRDTPPGANAFLTSVADLIAEVAKHAKPNTVGVLATTPGVINLYAAAANLLVAPTRTSRPAHGVLLSRAVLKSFVAFLRTVAELASKKEKTTFDIVVDTLDAAVNWGAPGLSVAPSTHMAPAWRTATANVAAAAEAVHRGDAAPAPAAAAAAAAADAPAPAPAATPGPGTPTRLPDSPPTDARPDPVEVGTTDDESPSRFLATGPP